MQDIVRYSMLNCYRVTLTASSYLACSKLSRQNAKLGVYELKVGSLGIRLQCEVLVPRLAMLYMAIDGFHGTYYHGNWRALHHHAAC